MSSEAAAIVYGTLVGGVLGMVGVLVGMLVERRLRERGQVRCVISNWEVRAPKSGPLGQEKAVCSFEVDLFNEKPSATGLRDVSVVFLQEDGERRTIGSLRSSVSDEEVGVLNLPPRRWVRGKLYAVFEGEEAREISGFREAHFVGYFPDGSGFRQGIVGRKPFVATRKKKHSVRKDYTYWWRRILSR